MKTILKDLKISEASFFPEPNEIFKENKNFSNEYCKIWTFNGLSVVASVRILYIDKPVYAIHLADVREDKK